MAHQIVFATKSVLQALFLAWETFETKFAARPEFIILSEGAWFQLKLGDLLWNYRLEVFGGANPVTYRGKAFIVSQAAQAPIEMVGLPGSLQSVVLTWAKEEDADHVQSS